MQPELKIQPGDKLLFIGDSITDCEYRGVAQPLGWGYVQLVAAMIQVSRPNLEVEILNRGTSGDTILDLEKRWENDVIREQPDTLYMMIGVNDVVNRHLEERKHLAVDDETYRATYRALIAQTLDMIHPRIILLEPTCLEMPLEEEPNRELAGIARIVNQIGTEFGLDVLPIFQRISFIVGKGWSRGWYTDFTHPYFSGHVLVALTIMEQMGLRVLPFPR